MSLRREPSDLFTENAFIGKRKSANGSPELTSIVDWIKVHAAEFGPAD
jgi:hypothetical protein